jgi:hypothetical protein
MSQPKLPYNNGYKVHLDIGDGGAGVDDTINPANNSSYSEAEWNALSRDEQEAWLDGELQEWAQNFMNTHWEE